MKVLLVEDEAIIAMNLEEVLIQAGYEVVGPASTVLQAKTLINEHDDIDCAVLDVNLRGEPAYPIAELLNMKGIPFIFTSGYGKGGIDQKFSDRPVLSKPLEEELLCSLITQLTKRAGA